MKKFLITIVLVLCFLPQVVFAASPLKIGSKGWKVRTVQQKLTVIGLKTPLTGKYDKALAKVVRSFQAKNKLKATGQVDDATYKKLMEIAFEKEGFHGDAKGILKTAAKYKGVPYGFGGTTPRAFDCSGYVQFVFNQHKVKLPRMADAQCEQGIFVLQKNLRPGDLVFFTTYEPGASHVGIYAGSGKFWHASSSRGVMLSGLKDEYWRTRYYGARRILVGKK